MNIINNNIRNLYPTFLTIMVSFISIILIVSTHYFFYKYLLSVKLQIFELSETTPLIFISILLFFSILSPLIFYTKTVQKKYSFLKKQVIITVFISLFFCGLSLIMANDIMNYFATEHLDQIDMKLKYLNKGI